MRTDLQNYIAAIDIFIRIKSFQNELFNSKNFLKRNYFYVFILLLLCAIN